MLFNQAGRPRIIYNKRIKESTAGEAFEKCCLCFEFTILPCPCQDYANRKHYFSLNFFSFHI